MEGLFDKKRTRMIVIRDDSLWRELIYIKMEKGLKTYEDALKVWKRQNL